MALAFFQSIAKPTLFSLYLKVYISSELLSDRFLLIEYIFEAFEYNEGKTGVISDC